MEQHAVAESLDQLVGELKALREEVRRPMLQVGTSPEAELAWWRQGHAEAQLDTAILALIQARAWIAQAARESDRHVPGEGPGGEVVRINGS